MILTEEKVFANLDLSRQFQRYKNGHPTETMPAGDCFRTALACCLRVERDSVPHFAHDFYRHSDPHAWWWETQAWLEGLYGLKLVIYTPDNYQFPLETNIKLKEGLGVIQSPRGNYNHCVIVDLETGKIVWDPYLGSDLSSLEGVELKEIYVLTEK